ncbi:MAG: triosephosphate isomerase, partial [Chitinophagaceae bacterium]|nr:triosephosphate isomerase [Chitinophagaceae bacterium]
MRRQIAAANWKMNLTYQEAEDLLDKIFAEEIELAKDHQVIFAVPFPYLIMANSEAANEPQYFVSAQNCYHKKSGAFTGEVSAEMLKSIGINYCIVGHSERREYFNETNAILSEKVDMCLQNDVSPIFCCGEALNIREQNQQLGFVQRQLEESLFHLNTS